MFLTSLQTSVNYVFDKFTNSLQSVGIIFHKLLQSMFLKTFSQTSVNHVFNKFTNSLQKVWNHVF